MNNNDKILFDFFYDLHGILSYKDDFAPGNHCQTVFEKATKVLQDKTYSDINLKGRHGDTYLHLVMQSLKHRPSNIKYAFTLMSLGANPFIKNIDQCTAFQKADSNILAEKFWNVVENYNFVNFKAKTEGYCIELKQCIFNYLMNKVSTFDNCVDIKNFLNDNGLFSNINYGKLLSHSPNIKFSSSIPEFLKCNPNAQENSAFLFHLLNKFFINLDIEPVRNSIIDFVTHHDFALNDDFFATLYDSKIHLQYQNSNQSGTAATFIIDNLIARAVNSEIHDLIDMDKQYKVNFSLSKSFHEILNSNLLKTTYLYVKLQQTIPVKEETYTKKLKI